MHPPEDGHKGGRNMEAYYVCNTIYDTLKPFYTFLGLSDQLNAWSRVI